MQLYQKSSEWCFANSHTSTFELIPSVASATRSLDDNWWRNGPFPRRTMNTDSATQRALRLEERNCRIPEIEPAVVERCQFDVRIHGVQQLATTVTSTLAHVQQFAVASTTETTTLVGRADVE